MNPITLLGPQRTHPTIGRVLKTLGIDGPVCVITAGWQEREGEVEELSGNVGGQVTDLMLYTRADDVFRHDSRLFDANRAQQDSLRELQRVYQVRLRHGMEAVRELWLVTGTARVLQRERRAAVASLRSLDRHHLRHVAVANAEFQRASQPSHSAVAETRAALAAVIENSAAVLIAGGHVAILRNRIRLFDLGPLIASRPIVAWSAGAMALADRIVLFHDTPPHGPGIAEVLDEGLGILPRVVPLPHARHRLLLEDERRVAVFARRFAPSECVTLDPGTLLHRGAAGWLQVENSHRLTVRGGIARVQVA